MDDRFITGTRTLFVTIREPTPCLFIRIFQNLDIIQAGRGGAAHGQDETLTCRFAKKTTVSLVFSISTKTVLNVSSNKRIKLL